MLRCDVLVIGAGMAGLSMCSFLEREGYNVIVVSPDTGGILQSFVHGGYAFDCGGHVYTTKSEITPLLERAGAKKHQRKAFYHHNNEIFVPYPVQDFASDMGIELRTENAKIQGSNFEELLINTFGREFYDKWARQFNSRVWSTSPIHMDVDWVRTRVKIPNGQREAQWGSNAEFYYVPGNLLLDAMGKPSRQICDTVEAVHYSGKQTIVHLSSGHVILCQYVVSTLHVSELQQMIVGDSLITGLGDCPLNLVTSVGLGLKRKVSKEFSWYYADVHESYHRVTLLSRYFDNMAPPGTDSLLVEIPHPRGHPCPIINWNKFLKTLNLDFDDVATIWKQTTLGYPIPTLGVRQRIGSFKKNLLDMSGGTIFTIGRWGSHAYYNIDHIWHEARCAFNMINDSYTEESVGDYLHGDFYYA